MADEITLEDIQKIIPAPVQDAYNQEAAFIVGKVRFARQAGESIIQKALTWVPYVDEVFQEQEIDVAAATSDVNRDARVRIVIDKIEKSLGYRLDDDTRQSIRDDVWQMYEKTMAEL